MKIAIMFIALTITLAACFSLAVDAELAGKDCPDGGEVDAGCSSDGG